MSSVIRVGYGLCVITHSSPGSGQTQVVTFGYDQGEDGTDPGAHATDMYNAWVGTDKVWDPALVSGSFELDQVQVYEESEIGLQTAVWAPGPSYGARASAPPAPQVSAIVKKRSAIVGRKFRGRFYLPSAYLVGSQVDFQGVITGSAVSSLQGRLAAFLGALITNDNRMVLLHSDPTVTPTPVISLGVESIIGTQRRRLR